MRTRAGGLSGEENIGTERVPGLERSAPADDAGPVQMSFGGIAAVHRLVTKLGLVQHIDDRLELLKVHLPYHESDHVLNLAYNVLCGGTRLEDIERLRHDTAYMNALGADLIPDPTTAGDFCGASAQESAQAALERAPDSKDGSCLPPPVGSTNGTHGHLLLIRPAGRVAGQHQGSVVNRPGTEPHRQWIRAMAVDPHAERICRGDKTATTGGP